MLLNVLRMATVSNCGQFADEIMASIEGMASLAMMGEIKAGPPKLLLAFDSTLANRDHLP